MTDTSPADPDDELGWDRDVHGAMADHATADDAVTTVPADEYDDGGSLPSGLTTATNETGGPERVLGPEAG